MAAYEMSDDQLREVIAREEAYRAECERAAANGGSVVVLPSTARAPHRRRLRRIDLDGRRRRIGGLLTAAGEQEYAQADQNAQGAISSLHGKPLPRSSSRRDGRK